MPTIPSSIDSTMNVNVLQEEPKTHPFTFGLLYLTLAASVVGTVLLFLAVLRYHTPDGSALSSDWAFQLRELEWTRNFSAVASLLFGVSAYRFRTGKGRVVWSGWGMAAACAQVLLLIFFSFGYIDCFSSCAVPAPSQFLWPAFCLSLACVLFGFISAIAIARLPREPVPSRPESDREVLQVTSSGVCPQCSAQLPRGVLFCWNCKSRLRW